MKLLKAIFLFAAMSIGLTACAQLYQPPAGYTLETIWRGNYKPSSVQADNQIQFPDKINRNFFDVDTSITNLKARVTVLEGSAAAGYWDRTGTILSVLNAGDDILLATNTERLMFGDGDSYIYESADDNIYIGTGNTNRVGITNTGVAFQVPIRAFTSGTTDIGASDRWWRNSYVEQYFIENIDTKIGRDGSGNMTLEDGITGSKTLAELAAGGTSYSAGSGLTLTSTTFSLGETLTQNTTIDAGSAYYLRLDGDNGSTRSARIFVDQTTATLTGYASTNHGISNGYGFIGASHSATTLEVGDNTSDLSKFIVSTAGISVQDEHNDKGIVGAAYYGAVADDNTYVQKKYVEDNELIDINAQTGENYTLVLSDKSKLVTLDNASAITLTVPPNSSVAFDYNPSVVINISQEGAGQVTIAPGAGVTINAPDSKNKLRVQYSTATLIKTGINTWLLSGDIAL
jgi:hypothetical protein